MIASAFTSSSILGLEGCYEKPTEHHQSPAGILQPDWPRANPVLSREQDRYTGQGLAAEAIRGSSIQNIDAARFAAWSVYLRSLAAPLGPLTPVEASRVRRFWQLLTRKAPGLATPHASAGVDGYFGMTWDFRMRHLEIEILPGATYDWFFIDHQSGKTDGEEDLFAPILSQRMIYYLRFMQ